MSFSLWEGQSLDKLLKSVGGGRRVDKMMMS